MTKHEEIAHLRYALDVIGKLPTYVSLGVVYGVLKEDLKHLEDSLTIREQFNHLWCKCKERIGVRPPCAMPGHAQDAP